MFLHILWVIPFLIFLYSYWREPRRLLNAYLLSISLINFLLVAAGLTVVSIEQLMNQKTAILLFVVLALLIPISVLLSTIYLLFNGKQMVTLEGRRLANLLSLLYGLGILLLIALHFLPRFPGKSFLLQHADFLLLYITFLYLSYVFYGFWCNLIPVKKAPDYIIVLGSGLFGDKVPPLLAQRLEKGKELYEKFEQKSQLIVSGGQGPDEQISEAEAMARYLTNQGVSIDSILIENKSRTTYENLLFSKAIMDSKVNNSNNSNSVLVVTNSFHALRAGVYMRRLGIKGRSLGSRTAFYYLPSAWIRETVGLVVMYWKWHAILLFLIILPNLISAFNYLIQLIISFF